MQFKLWETEVKRIAKQLGLNEDETTRFLIWSVDMAYDNLEKAQTRNIRGES